tara:strand:- start:132 stop:2354 length:2223 start_codon:yes stop_codon:yes gene_type:complete
MIKTYILGTGFLSNNLRKKVNNSKIYSATDFVKNLKKIDDNKKFNLIINTFYSSRKLNKIQSYEIFVKKSLSEVSLVIDKIGKKKINKIIYTSSSSVYGSVNNNIKVDDSNNRYAYSSLKLSAESLLKNFCDKKKIKLIICRLFNLYGGNENFSVISKLKDLKKNKIKKIKIFNKGESIRDFIHINDVTEIYKKLLISSKPDIYDIGTGQGIKIIDILNNLNIKKNRIIYEQTKNHEVDKSIAKNNSLLKEIKYKKFRKIENFLGIKKKIIGVIDKNLNYIEKNLIGSVIYGCGYSGKELAKQILAFDQNNISFFVDDDKKKIGKYFFGAKVISFKELKKIAKNVNLRNIIVAIPSLKKRKRILLIKKLLPLCNSISTLPEKSFYKEKKIEVEDIQKISLEEIFNRNFLKTNKISTSGFKNKNILVTGGAGSIGFEICKQLLDANPKKIIVLDHSEFNIYRLNEKLKNSKINLILGDIKDEQLIKKILDKYKIGFIFHAAAYKHVKFLEANILSAVENNIFGTLNILRAIKNKKINLTFISTDKAVKPRNILGITKRVGEILSQYFSKEKEYSNCRISIVRFGNVIGSDGSALPLFVNQIRQNLPISITDMKMKRYFMSIEEASRLVVQTSQIKLNGKIFVLDMGKQMRIIDIIKKLFEVYKRPNQTLKFNVIGNKFNEKISEKLFYKNKNFKTKFPKILFAKDPLPNKKYFFEFINKINHYLLLQEEKKLSLCLRNFFK